MINIVTVIMSLYYCYYYYCHNCHYHASSQTNSLDILQAVLRYIFCHDTNPIMVLFGIDHSLVSATMAF